MPNTPRYFLHNAGRVLGPFTHLQLRSMRDAERLRPNTEVSTDGRTWLLALTVPGLFADTPASAAPLDVLPAAPEVLPVRPTLPLPPVVAPSVSLAEEEPPYLPVTSARMQPSGSNTGLFIGLGIGAGVVFLAVVGLMLLLAIGASRSGRETTLLDRLADEDEAFNPSDLDIPAIPRRKMSVEELVKECSPSVGIVRGRLGHGSGFVVAPGIVATNYHVVEPQRTGNFQVSFPSAPAAQRGPYTATFLHGHKNRDLAFFKVRTNLRPLSVPASYQFRSGQEIVIIGSPGVGNVELLQNAVTRGLMSTSLTDGDVTLYQLDASVNPGNSGGPVLDESGQVVGVVTARARKEERLAFCVSVNDLRTELARARQK